MIIVNNRNVFTARPADGFPPGYIGLSGVQRPWAGAGLRDELLIQIYDPFRQGGEAYLGSADIEVRFAGKSRTDELYDQDDLAASVIKVRLLFSKPLATLSNIPRILKASYLPRASRY